MKPSTIVFLKQLKSNSSNLFTVAKSHYQPN